MGEDIYIRYCDMPSRIKSYTVSSNDGSYTIIINSRLSIEMQLLAYQHEFEHIVNGDFEKKSNVGMIELNAHQ